MSALSPRFLIRLALLLITTQSQLAHVGSAWADLPESVILAEQARVQTIARVSSSVVAIFPPNGEGGGSGVLISPTGLTLTNHHVVQDAGPFLKCGLNDGKIYDAVLIGIDPTGDVAIIQLLGRTDFPYAPLGDSDTVQAGDWAFAMGNPFLLAEDFVPTLTYGMVSGVRRYQYPAGTFLEYTDCIQVDTSINPGNSGGPLFNATGEVIGINGRISVEKRGRVNAGSGYAISINQIKHFRDQLLSGRIVDHATLGATVRTDEFSNVIIDNILPYSDAYLQGLRSGDEIVSFGGRNIGSVNQFKNVLGIYPKGWKVPLTYRREGQRYDLFVRLAPLHSPAELAPFATIPVENENPDEEKPPEETPPTLPEMLRPRKKAPAPPAQYAHLYEERMGFANYYFNRLKQEDLLYELQKLGSFGSDDARWTLQGTVSGETPFRLVITSVAGLLESPAREVSLFDLERAETYSAGWDQEGLLLALHQCQQLLTQGKDPFAEFYYVGSEPLDGNGPRVDVLATMQSGFQTRWYFDQEQKVLVGWDTWKSEHSAECGVRILKWTKQENYSRPEEFVVKSPGKPDLIFQTSNLALDQFIKPGAASSTPD